MSACQCPNCSVSPRSFNGRRFVDLTIARIALQGEPDAETFESLVGEVVPPDGRPHELAEIARKGRGLHTCHRNNRDGAPAGLLGGNVPQYPLRQRRAEECEATHGVGRSHLGCAAPRSCPERGIIRPETFPQ